MRGRERANIVQIVLKQVGTIMNEQLLVTVDVAAKTLGLGRTSIYRLMKDGQLPYVEVGARRRVRVADLKRVAEEGAPRRDLVGA